MRLWRKRPRETTHTGIQLRITLPGAGPLVEASSDHLHWVARYSGAGVGCQPDCLPGCSKHGWMDLLSGADMRLVQDPPGLQVEIRPVRLPD